MNIVKRTTVLVLLVLIAAPALFAQARTRVMRAEPGEVFNLREVSSMLREQDNQVKFMMVMPAQHRPEAYRSVDVKEGDILLYINGERIRKLERLKAVYDSIKIGDMIKLGLRRGDSRFISSFEKADPESLPQRRMMVRRTIDDGSGERVEMSDGETMITSGPGGAPLKPVMELGVILTETDGAATVMRKLPIPIEGMPEGGINEGDVLVSLNGKKVKNLDGFVKAFEGIKVGEKIALELRRDGKTISLALPKSEPRGRIMINTEEQ